MGHQLSQNQQKIVNEIHNKTNLSLEECRNIVIASGGDGDKLSRLVEEKALLKERKTANSNDNTTVDNVHLGDINKRITKVENQMKIKPATSPGCLIAIAIFFAVLLIVILMNHSSSHNNSSNALAMSQVFVKKKLLSPSTADFPGELESTITHLDNIWDVDSYVDAQNAFGAKIRRFYHCQLRYEKGTDNWYLMDFYFK